MSLKAAIIGAGKIAGILADPQGPVYSHAHAIANHPAFELSLVIDAFADKAQALGSKWGGADWTTDLSVLAERERLDLVAVCVPDAHHAQVLHRLLDLPQPPRLIVMEKPLCLTPDELKDLRDRCAGLSATTVVVNHSRRFDDRFQAIAELIASGEYGKLVGLRWAYYGGWRHTGPHVVDTLRLILRSELEPLAAWKGYEDRAGDPCIESRLISPGHPGLRILIESFPEQAFQLFEAELRLEKGRLRLTDFCNDMQLDEVVVNAADERELKLTRPFPAHAEISAMSRLYALAADHLAGLDGEIIRRAGILDAAHTMETLFAVLKLAD